MKSSIKYILLISLVAGSFFSSCNKDKETTPSVSRASLLGSWVVNDSQKKITYEVNFEIDTSTSNGILVRNFGGSGSGVRAIAYLSGVTLALKTDELLSNGWIVNGSGTVTGTTRIDWPYTLHDGADQNSFQAVYTKK